MKFGIQERIINMLNIPFLFDFFEKEGYNIIRKL